MPNLVVRKDGTDTQVLVDLEEPFHLNKNLAQTKCGRIITPTMHTDWLYLQKATEHICDKCENADIRAEEEAERLVKEEYLRDEIKTVHFTDIEDTPVDYWKSDDLQDAASKMMVWLSPHGAKYHRVLHKGMTGKQMSLKDAHGLTVERDGNWVTLEPCKTKPCFPNGVTIEVEK